MQISDIELLTLIIPPSITIIGWGVAAWWAIRQISLANKKNLELQRILMSESHKRSLASEIIAIYKDIASSIHSLLQSGNSLSMNVSLQEELCEEGIRFDANLLVDPVNSADLLP